MKVELKDAAKLTRSFSTTGQGGRDCAPPTISKTTTSRVTGLSRAVANQAIDEILTDKEKENSTPTTRRKRNGRDSGAGEEPIKENSTR
jgi:hypothetical protein